MKNWMCSVQRFFGKVSPLALNAVKKFWGWSVPVLLVLGIVKQPGILVTMPSQQQVRTSNAKVGLHTRLTDEVEEWKIQRTLSMVREMGAPWIVEYFPWAYIEYAPERYAWEHSDVIVKHATNQGVTVIARLGMVPDWARPSPEEQETTYTYLDQVHYEDFAHFVAVFAEHYRGQIRHIVIWNEPNLSFEWGYRPVDPAGYVDLLRVVYPEAHAANPDVVVLAGALASTLEPEGSPAGLSDVLYLEAMYDAGAKEYFDALAAHTYGMKYPPDEPPSADVIDFRRVELLREVMKTYGDQDKLIYITESGWNDHPRWVWAVNPIQRMQFTVDAFTWADEHWPWCPVVAMWQFRTPMTQYNYQDYHTFVTPDFQKKPIYEAVQIYTGNQNTP